MELKNKHQEMQHLLQTERTKHNQAMVDNQESMHQQKTKDDSLRTTQYNLDLNRLRTNLQQQENSTREEIHQCQLDKATAVQSLQAIQMTVSHLKTRAAGLVELNEEKEKEVEEERDKNKTMKKSYAKLSLDHK